MNPTLNYSELSEEDFQAHCTALYLEQDRRSKLGSIPEDIKKLAQDFEQLGGDNADLVTAVQDITVADPTEEDA